MGRGLLAGAAGTAVLTAAAWVDVSWRGGDASTVAERTVDAVAGALGREIPGGRRERGNRRTALAALAGTSTGLAVGVVASGLRSAGLRLPGALDVLGISALAMAAAELPLAALGRNDPRTRTSADRVANAVPHLAYGLTVHAVLSREETAREGRRRADPPVRASVGLVVRSALLGLATGGRSSLGLAAPLLSTPGGGRSFGRAAGRVGSTLSALAVVGELVGDKLPGTPSRLRGPGLPLRVLSGAGGAAALAHREHARSWLPVSAGALGALGGSYAGAAWRARPAGRLPGLTPALLEDAAAIALAALASRPGGR